MPRRSRLSVAICTVRACWASIIGWRGYTGTTPVPRPMPGTWEPATARSVSASGPKICDAKAWSSPASRYRCSSGDDRRPAACRSQSCSRCAAAWPCPWCSSRSLPVVSAPLSRRIPGRGRASLSTHPIGFVGAGQLARMAGEAASALGLSMAVLAEHPDDAACGVAAEVVLGSPFVAADLRAVRRPLRRPDLRPRAGRPGAGGRAGAPRAPWSGPGAATLELAVDKARMRTVLDEAGVPVPAYAVVDEGPGALDAVEALRRRPRLARHGEGGPRRLRRQGRVARGRPGRGGRACWPAWPDRSSWRSCSRSQAELAVMVARRPSGASAAWPAVETAQVGGVCREVLVPGRLDADVLEAASALGQKVAEIAGGVGVMAVELFWSGGRLLVNEVATRPHNSGHWTMEGAVTSQFENHVRAVLDLPLGSTAPQHPQVASVNVFGGPDGADPAAAPRPRPRRRGRPRPPLWQGGPAGTQTGARDGLWRRRGGGAVPGLVGRPRPRHPGARRASTCRRGCAR